MDDEQFDNLLVKLHGMGMKEHVVIRLLGLQSTVDTVVGNETLRGVSGGERKRVTSAEMLVGPKVPVVEHICLVSCMQFCYCNCWTLCTAAILDQVS